MSDSDLPQPVADFIAAMNHFDLAGLTATFAEKALVNDHRDEFPGRDAIREWARREIIGDRVTMNVTDAIRRGDSAAVTAEIDGAFDKTGLPQPLFLTFYFATSAGAIDQLVIVHNKQAGEPNAPATPKPEAAALESNRQMVARFFEFFSAGDVPAATSLFTEDATFWFPTTRRLYTMPEFAAALEWIKTRLDGPIRFEVGTMVAEENKVAVQLESFATTVDGKRFNNLYHIYFEFTDGKISRGREYNDTGHVYATLRTGQTQAV